MIAILGAGLSGLTCARQLQQAGWTVRVFDKGRGVSGRMSLRRVLNEASLQSETALQFDHGAQYFTARSSEFQQQVERWLAAGVVAEWSGPFVLLDHGSCGPDPGQGDSRYVGTPGMNAICKQLAEELPHVTCSVRIEQLIPAEIGWRLQGVNLRDQSAWSPSETFAAVVSTLPAPQACVLLPEACSFRDSLLQARMAPCWCVMVEFAERLPVEWGGAFVQNSPLRWVARDSSKPGRHAEQECWVLHASPAWSLQNLELTAAQAEADLLTAFATDLGRHRSALPPLRRISSHRWRYAIPENPFEVGCLHDDQHRLLACGDWSSSARIEGAFLSGLAAAQSVQTMLG